ncbi:MAG: DUF1559 domain-containing protein, partial [Planctomycetota bacterium]
MKHPDPETLKIFFTGRLPQTESEAIVQHLASCPECSQSCDAISAGKDLPVANRCAAQTPTDSATPFYDEVTIAPSRIKNSPSPPVDEAKDEFATQEPASWGNPANSKASQRSHFGRYRVEKFLGRGGFGEVYRAWDDQLKRPVAIKVTFQQFLTSGGNESYLAEAQTVASLDHPHIVPVFDVGQAENGDYYVVSKLIEGSDLAGRIGEQRPSRAESVAIIMSVAEALHHAHTKGLVHRDVKPANILIDSHDRAFLADFGIALREVDFGRTEGKIGTPAYMSPEQARGEGHRVDGRCDLYSLGVVLYELLTGRRPFQSKNTLDLLLRIAESEVRPPRQLDDSISRELERICLKALALRASDRYATGSDFAEDLRYLAEQETPRTRPGSGVLSSEQSANPFNASSPLEVSSPVTPTPTGPTRVVPRGLRSFDQTDAEFFLELLPGPVDRMGLPDNIRFWKRKIESEDSEQSFSVGLIYGPSGCGKSSLIKAGVIPRLADTVLPVYIEATGDDTEQRLARAIQKKIPALGGERGLRDTLTAIRRGQGLPPGKSLLLVIDQFEQWLHAHDDYRNTELTAALRQCDGLQVRCIVMVRDDFWLSVSRFMRELEVDIEASNSRLVDLFDLDHAARVLGLFGRAFGKLPDSSSKWTKDQQEFVQQAVAGLAEDRKVVCVRVALFAEMMKSRDWTTAVLREVGGTKGVGTTFLEETFSSRSAPPQYRHHQRASRAVLAALLPESDSDIKGHMRSQAELLEASGYQDRPSDFNDLLRILDGELRLITPTDPEGDSHSSSSRDSSLATRFFQLTHDYLVPSLREWLTRKQRETRKGRTELKLSERSATWDAKRENKQLPTVTEWFSIRVLTDKKHWTEPQRAMMRTAARTHGVMWGAVLLTVLLVGTGIQQWAVAERWKNLQEQTRAAAESLQNTLAGNLKELGRLPKELVLPELQTRFASATNARHKLSLAIALAGYGELDAEYLVSRIDDIADADTGNYVTALQANPTTAIVALKAAALKCIDKPLWRRKTKLATVALGLGDKDLAIDVCAFENRPDPEQRTLFIDEFPRWDLDLKAVLTAAKNSDSPALRSGICLAMGQLPVEKMIDADKESWKSVASEWFVDRSDTTTHSAAGWLLRHWKLPLPEIPNPHEVTPQRDWFVVKTSGATMLRIRAEPATVIAKYRQRLAALETSAAAELDKPEIRMERGIAHFETGNLDRALDDFTFLMEHEPGEALSTVLVYRTLTLARMGRADDARQSLARYLEQKVPASYRTYMEILVAAWLGDIPEASRQLATASSVASIDPNTMYNLACAAARCAQATSGKDAGQSQQFANRAIELLEGAVFRGYNDVKEAREDPDFVILHGDPRFASVLAEMDRSEKQVKVVGEFWVGDREVTRGQFEAFMNDANYAATEKPAGWDRVEISISPTADHPVQKVSWYDAVMYCNWLSQREGLQPCYERTGTKEKGSYTELYDAWRVISGATGYRLLHEAEWEYACRAGTTTNFSSGDDESLLVGYCQMLPSKLTSVCGEKMPNAWGLHDSHGNVSEWCLEKYAEEVVDTAILFLRVSRGGSFVLGESVNSFARSPAMSGFRSPILGFRVGRTLNPVPAVSPAVSKWQKFFFGRMQSANNLKQMGLAFYNFADANGHFPANIVDKNTGKPLLSWRVALLPYIGQAPLYKAFKLDEPWDSEHNIKLAKSLVAVYSLANQTKRDPQGNCLTPYQAFVGNGTLFEAGKKLKYTNVTDGTSN